MPRLLVLCLLVPLFLPIIARARAAGPDLTTTDLSTIDRRLTYNLGPTGARGWIHIHAGTFAPATDEGPYQILVTTVGAATPAGGLLQVNDVLLGASAGTGAGNLPVPLFTQDARKSLGLAIGAAEAGDGHLNLKRWRAGTSTDVVLQLPVLGAYSPTAPYNCPKSALILAHAAKVLEKESFSGQYLRGPILGLALLAIGDPAQDARLQAYARDLASQVARETPRREIDSWTLGYNAIFLGEYFLQTGDDAVLPALANLTRVLAGSQDRVGTFGHGGALLDSPNYFEHFIAGYGSVNAVGLGANTGIALGRRAMLAGGLPPEPSVEEAVGRAARFFAYFSGKGGIPYGEHEPWTTRGDDGKEAMAAVYFSLLGDRPAETESFARLSVADFRAREYGHTGPGFSFMWAGMGANVGGPEAAAAHLKEVWWHLDLARRSDGSFTYDGSEEGPSPGITDYWADVEYGFMDATAMYVMTYAIPNQRLYLHGKGGPATPRLSSAQVADAVAAGKFIPAENSYSNAQLMARLADPDPIARFDAAVALGQRADADINALSALTTAADPRQREASLHALGERQASSALPAMLAALNDTDNWVRFQAGRAIAKLGASASSAIPTLLARYGDNADLVVPSNDDPVQAANRMLGNALFGDKVLGDPSSQGLSSYLGQTSPQLLAEALGTGLRHPESRGRGSAAAFAANFATVGQLNEVFPDLAAMLRERPPVNVMWADAPYDGVVKAMSSHLYIEYVPLALTAIERSEPGSWGATIRAGLLLPLATYGAAARWTLPTLRRYRSEWDTGFADYPALLDTIAALEAAVDSAPGIRYGTPVAVPQVVAVTAGAKAITLGGTLPRPGSPVYAIAALPSHGTLSGAPPNVIYTPSAGFVGLDRFTFTVADAVDLSEPGTVSVIVGNSGTGLTGEYFPNADFTGTSATRVDATLDFDSANAALDQTLDGGLLGVRWTGKLLAPEPGDYRFALLHNGGVRLWIDGQLMLDVPTDDTRRWSDDDVIPLSGGRTYSVKIEYFRSTPETVLKFKWTGPSFAGRNGTVVGTPWLFPAAAAANVAPVAFAQSVSVAEDSSVAIVLAGGDANHDPLTYAIVTPPAHGQLGGMAPNVVYTPAANYNGLDSFTFRVNDGTVNSSTVTVSLTVTPVADLSLAGLSADYTGPSATTATLKAKLTSDLAGTVVTAFWGTGDGGTDPSAWAHSANAGTFPAGNAQNIAQAVTGLPVNTRQYYTFRATPSVGATVWAAASQSFGPATGRDLLTFGLPGQPAAIVDSAVIWELPANATFSALAPVLTASPGAAVQPPSGTVRDFSVQQSYVVTAENGSQRTYVVTAYSVPHADRYWALTGGNWNAATAWTNESGLTTPLAAGGAPDQSLHFPRPGTYTANNNLAGTFMLNRLAFEGAGATITGNALQFAADPAGKNPQLNQEGSVPVRLDTPIGLAQDLTLAGHGTGMMTIKGLIGSGQTTDGVFIHNGAHLLYLDTKNGGFAGGLLVSNATLRATVDQRTFGDDHDKWGPGGTSALRLSNAQLETEGFGGADWTWARMGLIELEGTNHIRALTKDGTFFRGDLHGSGLLVLDGPQRIAFGNHRFAPTFNGDVLISQTSRVEVAQTQPLGLGGTVIIAAPGGGAMGVFGSSDASLDNQLRLDTGLTLSWANTSLEFALERTISGPGGLTKSFDATDQGSRLVLRAANTYSGGTVFKSGQLHIYRGDSLGTGPVVLGGKASAAHAMVLVNETRMSVPNAFTLAGVSEPALNDPDALTEFNTPQNLTLAGDVDGTGGLQKTGGGTLILAGNNTWSGPTHVDEGALTVQNTQALGRQTALTMAAGTSLQLEFSGTLRVGSISLGGTALPPGIYSAATHPAFLSGTGQVDTRANTILNLPVTAGGTTSQTLKAFVISTAASADVRVYWGTANGGSNPAAWAHTATVGSLNDAYTEVSFLATGLLPSTGYFFTFRAAINGADVWAANVQSFTTSGTLGITTPPQAVTQVAGTTAHFTVAATGTGLNYRWQRNGAALFDDAHVHGAGSANLSITGVGAGDAASYRVVVSNASDSLASSPASLSVVSPPLTFLTWDANGSTAGQPDGAGAWDTSTPNWWTGAANQVWVDGNNAQFGASGSGGVVTLTGTFANQVKLGPYSGEYEFTGGALNVLDSLQFAAGGTAKLDNSLQGTGGIVVDGPGTLTLGGAANTYAGGTVVNAGEFHLNGGILPGTGPITVHAGAQMALGLSTVTNGLTLGGGTLWTWNDVEWDAPVTLSATSTFQAATALTIDGVVSGPGGFLKTDWGDLTFKAANTYAGSAVITRGRLIFKDPAGLGTGGLEIAADCQVRLAFSGLSRVDSLKLDGVPQPQGTYGSADSGAPHVSAFFEGPGQLLVGPAPSTPNTPPQFPAVPVQNVAEGTQLDLHFAATDADVPAQALLYRLLGEVPDGVSLTPSGRLRWTPTESQGPSSTVLHVVVTDGIASVTNQFSVNVTEVNMPPLLDDVPDFVLAEGESLGWELTATDPDIPWQSLSFGLGTGPAGLSVSSGGWISWIPSEGQSPGVFPVRVFATDGVASTTNEFQVTLTERNVPPVLNVAPAQVVAEGTPLQFTVASTDSDLPAQSLTYALADPGPAGLTVSPNGTVNWTPSETQGPGTYVIRVAVTDGVITANQQFTLQVLEVNVAPVFPAIVDAVVDENVALNLTLAATDADVPVQPLTFGLASGPAGLTVSPAGALAWTPTEAQGPATHSVKVFVSDGLVSVTNQFNVVVHEVNQPPHFTGLGDQSVDEGASLKLTLTAVDDDVPAQALTFGLSTGPAGLTVSSAGALAWTPTEAQGPATHLVKVFVSDGVVSVTNQFNVTVHEVNTPPLFTAIDDQSVDEGVNLQLDLSAHASDSDVPAQTLTFGLSAGPTGLVVSAAGALTWTPTEAQGPATHSVKVFVSDGLVSVTNQFNVVVHEVNQPPHFTGLGDQSVDEEASLKLTLTAVDDDVPAQALTFGLSTGPAGLTVSSAGALAWTPTEAQGPATHLVQVFVSDGVVSVTNQFNVTVHEVNTPPLFTVIEDQSVDEGVNLQLDLSAHASDSDIPAQTLTFGLGAGPTGLVVSPAGALTWTPTETQGPATHSVKVFVSDGLVSVTNQFNVVVHEVNQPPHFTTIDDQDLDEGVKLQLDLAANASDSDIPVQPLTFGLSAGPAGLTVSPAGALAWIPSEEQGPGIHLVRVFVSDGVASVTNEFHVTVREVNSPPVMSPVNDQGVDEGGTLAFTLTAADSDVPVQPLSFGLAAGPAGLSVTPAGFLAWTPTQTQGPSTNVVRVFVSDGVVSVTNQFLVVVGDVNVLPVFPPIKDQTVDEGFGLSLTLTATDSDQPPQTLTFGLSDGPAGMTVTAAGALSWTPTEAQGPAIHVVRVFVSDGLASVTNQFKVTVREVNQAPVFNELIDRSLDEETLLSFTLTATDADDPVQPLTFGLSDGPAGMTVTAAGALTWMPTEAQGPTTNVVKVFVSDGVVSVTNQFKVMVREVNVVPVFAAPGDQSVDAGATLSLMLAATDTDVPAQVLAFGLSEGPAGLTVSPAGALAWTPAAAEPPGPRVVRVFVGDGVASVTNQFQVVVHATDGAPVLPAGNLVINPDGLSFRFPTVAGRRYRLAYRTDLSAGDWLPLLLPPVFPAPDGWSAPADGSPMTPTDPLGGNLTRFYRLERAVP